MPIIFFLYLLQINEVAIICLILITAQIPSCLELYCSTNGIYEHFCCYDADHQQCFKILRPINSLKTLQVSQATLTKKVSSCVQCSFFFKFNCSNNLCFISLKLEVFTLNLYLHNKISLALKTLVCRLY